MLGFPTRSVLCTVELFFPKTAHLGEWETNVKCKQAVLMSFHLVSKSWALMASKELGHRREFSISSNSYMPTFIVNLAVFDFCVLDFLNSVFNNFIMIYYAAPNLLPKFPWNGTELCVLWMKKRNIFYIVICVCCVCVFSYDSYCHSWQDGNSCELASITYAFNSSVIPLTENEDTPWTQQG